MVSCWIHRATELIAIVDGDLFELESFLFTVLEQLAGRIRWTLEVDLKTMQL